MPMGEDSALVLAPGTPWIEEDETLLSGRAAVRALLWWITANPFPTLQRQSTKPQGQLYEVS